MDSGLIDLICTNCGGEFQAARRHARTCSTRCRVAAHRARQAIPGELRRRDRWVRWKRVRRNSRWTRMPLRTSGKAASSTDPATWSKYTDVRDCQVGDGIGFVLNGDGVVCLDLDHCIEDGKLTRWAEQLVALAGDTYVERSPSGEGLHIWGRARVERGRKLDGVEVYGSGRYITVTGDRWFGKPSRLGDITELVDDVLAAGGRQVVATT